MTSRYRIKPVGDNVVIVHDENMKMTAGGIILPDQSTIPVLTGRVVAVSQRLGENGYEYPFETGDRVVYNVKAAVPIDLDPTDRQYIVPADAILGVIEEQP